MTLEILVLKTNPVILGVDDCLLIVYLFSKSKINLKHLFFLNVTVQPIGDPFRIFKESTEVLLFIKEHLLKLIISKAAKEINKFLKL